jgi:hypothetical protein
MPTIKGPIKMKGFNTKEFLAKQTEGKLIKLPFEATGFKSTKIPEGVDMSGIKMAKEKPKAAEKPKTKDKKELP